ncbi:MAG: hypothetical protein ABSB61_04715 [Anaerolineales bacterium]|jgi:uncharacterized membrane-anchored protein
MTAPTLSSFVILLLMYEAALALFYVRPMLRNDRRASPWNWRALTLIVLLCFAMVSWSFVLHHRGFLAESLSLNVLAIALAILGLAFFYFRLRALRDPTSIYQHWRVIVWLALATFLAGILLPAVPTP